MRKRYLEMADPDGTSLAWPPKTTIHIESTSFASSITSSADEVEYLSMRCPREYRRTRA